MVSKDPHRMTFRTSLIALENNGWGFGATNAVGPLPPRCFRLSAFDQIARNSVDRLCGFFRSANWEAWIFPEPFGPFEQPACPGFTSNWVDRDGFIPYLMVDIFQLDNKFPLRTDFGSKPIQLIPIHEIRILSWTPSLWYSFFSPDFSEFRVIQFSDVGGFFGDFICEVLINKWTQGDDDFQYRFQTRLGLFVHPSVIGWSNQIDVGWRTAPRKGKLLVSPLEKFDDCLIQQMFPIEVS